MPEEITLNEIQTRMVDESPFDFTDLRALYINCTLKRSPSSRTRRG